MTTLSPVQSSGRNNIRRTGRGFLGVLALVYFYFCDDIVLAGPIIAVTAKWGILAGTIFGVISCAIWNIPQTLVFLGEMRNDSKSEDKYARLESIVKVIGWFQPIVVFTIAYGPRWGFVSVLGVALLYWFNSWFHNRQKGTEEQLTTRFENIADFIWRHHWLLYLALFFIGPQMSLVPVAKSNAKYSDVRRIGYKLIAVYSIEFALGYTIGFTLLF